MTDSPFAIRGVIEGFYGTPWTHEQRTTLIDFLAHKQMNTFVYAPKDDSLVRHDWRTMYTGTELSRLSELIEACRARDIDFVYCLSPGLSIEYSSAADRDRLVAKLESVAALGVDDFGLLLDDIPPTLQHPTDADAFADLVTAHIDLVDDIFSRSPGSGRFFVCPTQYWGLGNEDYIVQLGRGLDPRIDLLWTGRAICSATLDLADAAAFAESTGRRPTYWDNYPVNDVAMTYELHVGPYLGRDPRLHESATGIIANGMELFESSTIAFATIADYLIAPDDYDAEASWTDAIRSVAGSDADDYAVFADNVRTSCLSADDAPTLQRALDSFFFHRSFGDVAAAADELSDLADRMARAADHLLRGKVENPQLMAEARPWIAAFEVGAMAIRKIAELHRAGKLEVDGPRVLGPYLTSLRDARVRVFGDVLDMALAELTGLGPPKPHDHIITAPSQ